MNCKNCKARCYWAGQDVTEPDHGNCYVGYVPKTNADRIRAMTDEELAHLLGEFTSCENCPAHSDVCEMDYKPEDMPTCEQIWIEWLKQEAKEGE